VNIVGIGKLKKEKRKKHVITNTLFSGSIYRMMCCKHSGSRALLRINRALLRINKGVLRIYGALLGICRAVRINRLFLWDIDGSLHDEQGSFVDRSGSLRIHRLFVSMHKAHIQGSFQDEQGSFVDIQGFFGEICRSFLG